MKYTVITLTPPYGTLMMLAATRPDLGKHIETRGWATQYRGPLFIHQGKNLNPVGGLEGLRDLCLREPFKTALRAAGFDLDVVDVDRLPMGEILGNVELLGVEEMLPGDDDLNGYWRIIGGKRMHWPLTPQERAFGDYKPGRFAWLCADPRPLAKPIPTRGYQRLWSWEGTIEV